MESPRGATQTAAPRTRTSRNRAFGGSDSATRWFAEQPDWWESHYLLAVDEISSFLTGDGISLVGRHIVDIGCGDGILSLGLANRTGAARVVGVDLEPVDMQFLLDKVRAHGVPPPGANLHFETSLSDSMPLADSSFDLAVAWSVFEHVHDLSGLIAEIRRVLAPDGLFFCQVWPLFHSEHGSHLWNWFAPFDHLSQSESELGEHLREKAPEMADEMLDLYESCNRATLDEMGRFLVDGGFYISKVELLTGAIHVPPALQHVPLSLVGISGFKLTAVNHK
jgi:ubiquinone/menaquinone biosynthesis C-methylase UbiE